MSENEIAKIIIDSCFKIHRKFGPGLLESAYEELVAYELKKTGFQIKRQHGIALLHEEVKLDVGYRADLIVEDKVIVEIKSIVAVAPVHYSQVKTYMRLAGIKLGLLVNFNEALLKDGLRRVVDGL